ncbi:PepSY-associated TM helix domain-containing protein [Sphingomonas montanisoli]|uniref:PepSY-associated TM helix domain-containing protein n=1 Tax=Sphingomonas montanisoli TaxID=2606412 RepID=A0A5D9C7F9_9SPHN|nr:PepSY-associated TM helix domain-containing protein [Sphingomonas montanisoli]TZG27808.1 hypothetical protein FYJ91_09625 [Sphingomonas montanisoli]
MTAQPADPKANEFAAQARRGFWLKHLTRWHWISAAISMIGMVLFSFTGITLNHTADIDASPSSVQKSVVLPAPLLRSLPTKPDGTKAPLPENVRKWAADKIGARLPASANAEWSADEVYLPLPRPGGDAWLSIDRASGDVSYERTDRGWIAWANDLHKGRNTGKAWAWFIDIFAVAALFFSITGLVLLQMHARRRPSTWPLVGFGLLLPVLIIILFIH